MNGNFYLYSESPPSLWLKTPDHEPTQFICEVPKDKKMQTIIMSCLNGEVLALKDSKNRLKFFKFSNEGKLMAQSEHSGLDEFSDLEVFGSDNQFLMILSNSSKSMFLYELKSDPLEMVLIEQFETEIQGKNSMMAICPKGELIFLAGKVEGVKEDQAIVYRLEEGSLEKLSSTNFDCEGISDLQVVGYYGQELLVSGLSNGFKLKTLVFDLEAGTLKDISDELSAKQKISTQQVSCVGRGEYMSLVNDNLAMRIRYV